MHFIYKNTLLVRLSLFVIEANRFQASESSFIHSKCSIIVMPCGTVFVSLRQLCSRLFFGKFVLMNCWTNDLTMSSLEHMYKFF